MSEQHTFPRYRDGEGSGANGSILQRLPDAFKALGTIVSHDWSAAVREYPVARRAQQLFQWVVQADPSYRSGTSVLVGKQLHRPTPTRSLHEISPREVVAYLDGINRVAAERRYPSDGEATA